MAYVDDEIKSISISKNLNDMKGPCNRGFHVPTSSEGQLLIDILRNTCGNTFQNAQQYLKLMPGGYIGAGDTGPTLMGTTGNRRWAVWCCNAGSSDYPKRAYGIMGQYYGTSDYALSVVNTNWRAIGLAIRPFKDEVVLPDSSWTTLYNGGSGTGIFWNSSLGLITLKDSTNSITIADKDLGAANTSSYGNKYQWGNNYGFTYNSITTWTSGRVDATNYGPGNYYSSNIAYYSASDDVTWDSSNNNNLWGGVSQGTSLGEVPIKTVSTFKQASDMKGPCDSGFHVPTETEAQNLLNIMSSLGLSGGGTLNYYLYMPYSGTYNYSGTYSNSNFAHYWTSNITSYQSTSGVSIFMRGSPNQAQISSTNVASGCSIRPFKDEVVIPGSSWTTLYQGTGNAGIYHNSTLGLISLSSDGTTWITIADKNLGATVIANQGDTLSESNCGKLYQRGNNYGFPRNGTLTTSSTQVNASTYGPGNYYSSSKFITGSYSWDSSNNTNLWGGVSQSTHMEEYILYTNEEPQPTTLITTDYASETQAGTGSNTYYYFGVKFTALKSGKINKVILGQNSMYGTLKITNTAYAGGSGTTYTLSGNLSNQAYELSTPYEIIQGQNYTASVLISSGNFTTFSPSFPKTCTAVRYDYSTYSYNNSQFTNAVYAIKGLEIEYEP